MTLQLCLQFSYESGPSPQEPVVGLDRYVWLLQGTKTRPEPNSNGSERDGSDGDKEQTEGRKPAGTTPSTPTEDMEIDSPAKDPHPLTKNSPQADTIASALADSADSADSMDIDNGPSKTVPTDRQNEPERMDPKYVVDTHACAQH